MGGVGKRHNAAGFTLLEMILAITVLGIVSISAVPFFANVGASTADAAARKLLTDMNYVRRLAQSRSGVYGISFDAGGEAYTVYQYDAATNTSTTLTDPHTQAPMVVDFDALPAFSGVNLQNPSFGGTAEIRFTAQGFPQNAANANLNATGTVQLSSASTVKTLTVQPNTGEVSLQ